MVRTWKRRDARQHWPGRGQPPRGMAPTWTGRPRQAGGLGPRWSDPRPDILWSAPGSAGMPASIGLGEASHSGKWPRPGPGGPDRKTTEDHGGRTPDRVDFLKAN